MINNQMKSGDVQRSIRIYLKALENLRLETLIKAVQPVIASNGVPHSN